VTFKCALGFCNPCANRLERPSLSTTGSSHRHKPRFSIWSVRGILSSWLNRRRWQASTCKGRRPGPCTYGFAIDALLLTVRRRRFRGLARRVLWQDLDRNGFSRGGAVVCQRVYVAAAGIDEPAPSGIGLAAARWVVARVVGHRSGQDQDQAGSGVRVPSGRGSGRELVVDDVDVGEPARFEPRSPVGQNWRASTRNESNRDWPRIVVLGAGGVVAAVARTSPAYTALPRTPTRRAQMHFDFISSPWAELVGIPPRGGAKKRGAGVRGVFAGMPEQGHRLRQARDRLCSPGSLPG